jgi:ABC-type Mn2+/Zn2+ transport system ATPase subunit
VITARGLSKRYGDKLAVDDLSFTVQPGRVTGFLGPNGAGKSTTIRMILGLDAPTSGEATVNGRRYAEHSAPLQEVGALLEARAVGASISRTEPDVLEISGLDSDTVGRIAADHSIVLYELVPLNASLEEAFMDLTREDVEYRAHETTGLAGAGRSGR